MKLFPLLSISAAALTSFDDALAALESRYSEMGLKRVDTDLFLRKRIKKMRLKTQKRKATMESYGCFQSEIDHDFTLNIKKKCNIASTLTEDAHAMVKFFEGSNVKHCKKFRKWIISNFADKFAEFDYGRYVTCEVKLPSKFGGYSTLVGRVQGDAIVFDGIKYGDHSRFMRSTAAAAPETKHLFNPSVSCPIASNVMTGATTLPRTTPENEDCLYLKVTAPLSAFEDGAQPRKVLTWIHGGAFNFGGMDAQYEDPTPLVSEQDIIVVKMNYRLGPFANWYFPFRTDQQPKSNFGLLDQRLAMKWVRDNISSFNGDDGDITLAGASAGGAAVSVHATHEDSWPYFDNVIIMSATQVAFWPESDAQNGYAYIATEVYPCTTAENFVADLTSGALISCLQSIPTEQFQQIMSQAAQVFSGIALEAGRLTQLESTFAPNYDSETLLADPRKQLQSKNYHDNLGFIVLEVTAHEGTTMSQNIFRSDAMRGIIFGDLVSQLYVPGVNDNVILPLAGYEGFIGGLGLPEPVVPLVLQAFPCAPNTAFGQAAPLMTECVDPVADFVNAYLFTCPIELAAALSIYDQDYQSAPDHYHGVVFAAASPGPGPYEGKPFLLPYRDWFDKCYATLENKSCHVEGARWFFGEYLNQKLDITDEQRDFGVLYRSTYADLMKNGQSLKLAEAKTSNWTKFTVENQVEIVGRPMEAQCQIFNSMEQQAGFYGKF